MMFDLKPQQKATVQRILDATVAAGGVLIDNFDDHENLWLKLSFACAQIYPRAIRQRSRGGRASFERRRKRIIGAARLIQREMKSDGWNPHVEHAKFLEQIITNQVFYEGNPNFDSGSALTQLVGACLALYFEATFGTPAGYTTDPDSGKTDGPFIRFVDQTLREFGITKSGGQPYQGRSIADALNEYKRIYAPADLRRRTPQLASGFSS